jgi:hypothetical protein
MMNAVEKLAAATKVVTHYLHRNESELLRQLPDDFTLRIGTPASPLWHVQLIAIQSAAPVEGVLVEANVYDNHIWLNWNVDENAKHLCIERVPEKE